MSTDKLFIESIQLPENILPRATCKGTDHFLKTFDGKVNFGNPLTHAWQLPVLPRPKIVNQKLKKENLGEKKYF